MKLRNRAPRRRAERDKASFPPGAWPLPRGGLAPLAFPSYAFGSARAPPTPPRPPLLFLLRWSGLPMFVFCPAPCIFHSSSVSGCRRLPCASRGCVKLSGVTCPRTSGGAQGSQLCVPLALPGVSQPAREPVPGGTGVCSCARPGDRCYLML